MGWGSFRDKYVKPAVSIASGGTLAPLMYADKIKDAVGGLKGVGDDLTGKTGEEAAERASMTQAGALMEQLDYLKEINKAPQQYKEEALLELRNLSFEPGAEGDFFEKLKTSPMYTEIMKGKQAGEEGVLRHASQTGGLRSGNVQEALYDYNTSFDTNALNQVYNEKMSGLRGLAGVPTNENVIGNVYSDIGEAKAAGITGAAQSRQQGTQNMMNFGLGIAGLFV